MTPVLEHFQALIGRILVLVNEPGSAWHYYLDLLDLLESEREWMSRAPGPWEGVAEVDRSTIRVVTVALVVRLERLLEHAPETETDLTLTPGEVREAWQRLFDPVTEATDEWMQVVHRISGSAGDPPTSASPLH